MEPPFTRRLRRETHSTFRSFMPECGHDLKREEPQTRKRKLSRVRSFTLEHAQEPGRFLPPQLKRTRCFAGRTSPAREFCSCCF